MVRKQKPPQIIETQLYKDEELVWWGQPVPLHLARKINVMQILMSIFMIGFALFFINVSQEMFSQSRSFGGFSRSNNPVETFLPIFFIIVPGIMIATAGWSVLEPFRKYYEATQTYYALTNKRAIIIKNVMSTQTRSFYDENMEKLEVTSSNGGVGDVIFGSESFSRSDGHGGTRTSIVPIGFLAVEDARVVEDFVSQIFFNDA